jgi:hypothetical protein
VLREVGSEAFPAAIAKDGSPLEPCFGCRVEKGRSVTAAGPADMLTMAPAKGDGGGPVDTTAVRLPDSAQPGNGIRR